MAKNGATLVAGVVEYRRCPTTTKLLCYEIVNNILAKSAKQQNYTLDKTTTTDTVLLLREHYPPPTLHVIIKETLIFNCFINPS